MARTYHCDECGDRIGSKGWHSGSPMAIEIYAEGLTCISGEVCGWDCAQKWFTKEAAKTRE